MNFLKKLFMSDAAAKAANDAVYDALPGFTADMKPERETLGLRIELAVLRNEAARRRFAM